MLPLGTPLDTSLKELEDVGMRGPSSVNLPVGGRLRHFWPVWHRMGANRRVVRWLKFGFPLRFDQSYVAQKGLLPLSLHPPDSLIASYRDQSKRSVLNEMLTLLVQKQCVTVMSEREVGFFFQGIPSSEEERRLPLSDRSLRAQRVVGSSDFHDGHAQSRKGDGSGGNVGDVSGSQRCLSPHPDSSTVSEIPVFSSRRPQVSPSSATVWPDVGSVGVHGGSETNKEVDGAVRHHPLPISGRLAECARVSSSMLVSHAGIDAPPPTSQRAYLVPTQSIEFLGERFDLLHSRSYLVPERRLAIQSSIGASGSLERSRY